MKRIKLLFAQVELPLVLRNTPTAQAILHALPQHSVTHTWGEEVYFEIPVTVPLEADAKDIVSPGEIAFWTEGNCIAIGYGPTPISSGTEIRLATRTNIWADSESDVAILRHVSAGESVRIEELN
ncbi:MAG: cyclophilin-like fold protein [Gammaproteobacteria bacterium]|nr:cyclophilin-like fold protein [Gammaproteobacteria bacterium]MDH5651653.1 cyclophilin-like fold protein [Gammaproteobacteria bacterium]